MKYGTSSLALPGLFAIYAKAGGHELRGIVQRGRNVRRALRHLRVHHAYPRYLLFAFLLQA
jgi:hypothetical protein